MNTRIHNELAKKNNLLESELLPKNLTNVNKNNARVLCLHNKELRALFRACISTTDTQNFGLY